MVELVDVHKRFRRARLSDAPAAVGSLVADLAVAAVVLVASVVATWAVARRG